MIERDITVQQQNKKEQIYLLADRMPVLRLPILIQLSVQGERGEAESCVSSSGLLLPIKHRYPGQLTHVCLFWQSLSRPPHMPRFHERDRGYRRIDEGLLARNVNCEFALDPQPQPAGGRDADVDGFAKGLISARRMWTSASEMTSRLVWSPQRQACKQHMRSVKHC